MGNVQVCLFSFASISFLRLSLNPCTLLTLAFFQVVLGTDREGSHPSDWKDAPAREKCLADAGKQIAKWTGDLGTKIVQEAKAKCNVDLVGAYKNYYQNGLKHTSISYKPHRTGRRLLGTGGAGGVKYQTEQISLDGAGFQDNPYGPKPTASRRRYQKVGSPHREFLSPTVLCPCVSLSLNCSP